jgi:hypothetical protein
MKIEYRTDKQVECEFWFCADDINRCVKGTKKNWVIDWPSILTTWPIKIGTTPFDKNSSTRRCRVSASTTRGAIATSTILVIKKSSSPMYPIPGSTKPRCLPLYNVWKEYLMQPKRTHYRPQKQVGECWPHDKMLCHAIWWWDGLVLH